MNNFRKLLYLVLLVHISFANAGSYDDFFVALIRDDPGAIQSLARQGFDVNSRDPKGQPAMVVAIQRDSRRALDALLATPGIDVNALNASGESALMFAAIKGDLGLCERLLERGARVNQSGWAPLHYAASGPNPKIVQLLLARGAEIEAESPNRSTPLMMAARYGSEESVQALLERGADPARRNERELAAADFARLGGRERLAERLQSAKR